MNKTGEIQKQRLSTIISYTNLLIRRIESGLSNLVIKLSFLISVVQGQLVKCSLKRKERRHEHEGRDTELATQHNNQLH